MFVSDYTIKAEKPCDLFKNLGRSSAEAGKKIPTTVLKSPDRGFEMRGKLLVQLHLKVLKQRYLLFRML